MRLLKRKLLLRPLNVLLVELMIRQLAWRQLVWMLLLSTLERLLQQDRWLLLKLLRPMMMNMCLVLGLLRDQCLILTLICLILWRMLLLLLLRMSHLIWPPEHHSLWPLAPLNLRCSRCPPLLVQVDLIICPHFIVDDALPRDAARRIERVKRSSRNSALVTTPLR